VGFLFVWAFLCCSGLQKKEEDVHLLEREKELAEKEAQVPIVFGRVAVENVCTVTCMSHM